MQLSPRTFSLSSFRYHTTLLPAALLLSALYLGGCGDESSPSSHSGGSCIPGQSLACACSDGQQGAQSCLSDGSGFEACICAQPTGASGAAGNLGSAGTAGAGGPVIGNSGSGGVGVSGAAGTTGAAGASGASGSAGTAGTAGAAGTSGASGSAGTAGSSGSGGDDCSAITDPISDFESASTPRILDKTNPRRRGPWYSWADTGGTALIALQAVTGSCGSSKALHVSGTAAGPGGAVAGFDFDSDAGVKYLYNASAATGLALWIKGGSGKLVRLEYRTDALEESANQGSCTGEGCSGFFGADLTMTGDWQLFKLPFSSLSQPNWGKATGTLASQLSSSLGVQFKITTGSFDFIIDDIGFY